MRPTRVAALVAMACAGVGCRVAADPPPPPALPSPGQLVPATLAPQIRQTEAGIVLPSLSQAPPGAEKVSVRVGDVVVEGGDPALAGATEAILAPLRGQVVTVAQLYVAANAIERAYANGGYFLTRVVIPPQTLKPGGALRLIVIEGFIESIDASTLADQVRARVSAILAPLIGRRRLTLGEFERALLIAGDTVGLELKTNLTTGQAQGSVRLVLAGDYRPISGEVSGDNSLSQELGRITSTVSVSTNSVLHLGEQIYINSSGAPNYGFLRSNDPRRLAGGGFIVPLGLDGLSLNIERVWSQTDPHVDAALVLPTRSIYDRWSARLLYPLIRNRTDTLLAHLGFDLITEKQTAPAFDTELYEDRLRVLRGGFDYSRGFETGTSLSLGGDLSQGFHMLGSVSPGEATQAEPISRADASDAFTKFEGHIKVRQELPASFALEVVGRGQYAASGPLRTSEQFSLGGPGLLSGYDAATFSGDHGWLVRAEFQYDRQVQVPTFAGLVAPYLFAARGQVITLKPTAAEIPINGADSLGLGVRTTINPADPTLRQIVIGLEGARQVSDIKTVPDQWRVNFYGAINF